MNIDYRHADQMIRVNGHILWLGDIQAAEGYDWLKNNNIRTVITVGTGFNISYDASIQHYKYSISDSKHENIGQYFDDAVKKITRGLVKGSVLVHCGAGVSRSASIVIAYLINTKMMTFLQALKFVRGKRSVICPNIGFERQLKNYQKIILGTPLEAYSENQNNQKTLNRINFNGTILNLNFKPNEKSPVKASTPFLKSSNNDKKQLQRMTLLKQWKLEPRTKHFEEFPALFMSKSLTNSQGPRNQKKSQLGFNSEERTKQLKKIAEFRFGVTNTQKWKIF